MAANKRQVVALVACAASQYFLEIINRLGIDSNSDSENDEELVQEVINIEANPRTRGKKRKAVRVEGFVEYTIPRLSAKQFKEHFRISTAIFDNLENKIGNLLLRQKSTGRSTISVRKQLLATLWLLATPNSYR